MLSSGSVGEAGDGEAPGGSVDRHGAPSRERVLMESALLHATRAAAFRARAEARVATSASWLPSVPALDLAVKRLGHRVAFARLLAVRTARAVREDGPRAAARRVMHRTLGTAPPAQDAAAVIEAPPDGPPATVPPAQPPPAPSSAGTADRVPAVRADVSDRAVPFREPPVPPGARDGDGDGDGVPDFRAVLDAVYRARVPTAAALVLAPRVLLVAETTLPQCAKYRVWQKKAHLDRLGVDCTVLDWRDWIGALSRLQTHTLLLLYRVPLFPDMRTLVDEARRLRVEILWEVDDLIFDVALYGRNANVAKVSPRERAELLDGARLYRDAMMTSDRTIASTETLARLMEDATGRPSHVVENALDRETLDFAAAARTAASRARTAADGDRVVVFYGSGTTTHDADIAVAAPALADLMAADPRVVFRVTGPLTLPAPLAAFGDRVERRPFTNYRAYLHELARADISIAPLEPSVFNDAKSNIKLIEAAIVGVPSVCSPATEFRRVATDGVDAFLAGTDDEWRDALRTLAEDPARRRAVAEAAERLVLDRYAPGAIATRAMAPVLAPVPSRPAATLRILVVNIYYAPRSLGGATVVAEEMARRLHGRDGIAVSVFTSHERHAAAAYTLSRYEDHGIPVIGVALPPPHDAILNFDDPEMARVFDEVLAAVRPDVVHFHCLQDLGAGLPRACQIAGTPYVVTMHDAWWLCPRQFMVRADNTYCGQTTIDLKVCQPCVPEIGHLRSRMHILMQALAEAALLLSPSEAHAELYRANGFAGGRVRVNRNGVRRRSLPSTTRTGRIGPLRFGFVGGNNAIKGVSVIRDAFARLSRSDWTLRLVDASLALGFPSIPVAEWRFAGSIEIVPPYDQAGLDRFFDEIDVLLFPSQWRESFGLTVREAMLRHVWVVATECGAAIEDLTDGTDGTLIPMGNDPEPLARAVEGLLDRAGAIRAWRARAAVPATIVTFDEQAAELAALLRACAGPGPSSPPSPADAG